jgi:thiamine-monophosphate kinase
MGATPRWATLSAAIPSIDEKWLAEFSAGLFALADRYSLEVVGGDTTRGPVLTLSVTALGEVPPDLALTRAGACPGDDIWVSGELGDAALALVHPEVAEAARRLHMPEPRVELGERLRGIAHAAIDVSDGLAGDLGHILERSHLGAVVEYENIPRNRRFDSFKELEKDCVLSGGDDYELIFTAPQQRRVEIEALSKELGLALSRIGTINTGAPKLVVLDAAGKPMTFRGGFDHFA